MVNYCEGYWQDVQLVSKQIPNIENLYGSTIFITGATGMICSAVAEVLFYLNKEKSANIQIVLAGRSKDRMKERFYCFEEGKDYTFLRYDAISIASLNIKADFIIHGASNADPCKFAKEPVETILANIIGLNTLLKSATSNNAKRLLYISSSEVYGRKEEKRPYKEDDYGFVDILNPRASYPSSKRAAETLCSAYSAEYGLDTVIVRPGHIYGPTITNSDSRASAQFTRKAKAGGDIIMKSAGSQLRSYCYTLDCASAILTVLINGKCGEAFNISNPDSVITIREMADALAKAGNVSITFEIPSKIEKNNYNLMDNSSLDSFKIEELGWHAHFLPTEGAISTLKFYKDE